MFCKYCGSANLQKRGTTENRRRYFCNECGRYPSYELETEVENKEAKILVYDIETSLMKGYFFSPKTEYIRHDMIEEDSIILTWSAKWLGEDDIMSSTLTPKEAKNRDDKRVSEEFYELLNQADIVVAHNGDRFDIKHMNAKFFEHGLNPPLPFRSVDTLKIAKRYFSGGFPSLALDYLTRKLKISGKIQTNVQLWKDCGNGDKEALLKMSEYCDNDVVILEDFYVLIRPWDSNHPPVGMYRSEKSSNSCPVCNEKIEIVKGKLYTTKTNAWKTYRCTNPACGATGRTKLSALTKNERALFIAR